MRIIEYNFVAGTKPVFKSQGKEQPGRMGVAATPKCKEGAYWIHKEGKGFEGSYQKFFDHYAFYIGCNVTNVFYNAPRKIFTITSPAMPENALCKRHLISIRKLQYIIFNIEKTITRYQMIKIHSYGRVVLLSWAWALPPCLP